jgi:hypothetical protein
VPDATTVVWPTVDPVDYPAGFDRLDAILDRAARDGDERAFTTLPWRAYRKFSWGNGPVSADPAPRWFDRDAVVDDDLQVGSTTLVGENERARRLGHDLASLPLAEAVGTNGIGWVMVYRDDPAAADLDLGDLEQVYADADLALYLVPRSDAPDHGRSSWRRATVVGGDLVAVTAVLGAAVIRVRRSKARRRPGR